jgi:hypothetical protein
VGVVTDSDADPGSGHAAVPITGSVRGDSARME